MSSPGVLELLQISPPAFTRRRDYSVFQLIPVLSFGQPLQHPLTWLWSPKALFRTVSTPSAALVRRGYSWHTLQKCSQSIQPSFFMEQMSKAQTSHEFIKWSSQECYFLCLSQPMACVLPVQPHIQPVSSVPLQAGFPRLHPQPPAPSRTTRLHLLILCKRVYPSAHKHQAALSSHGSWTIEV